MSLLTKNKENDDHFENDVNDAKINDLSVYEAIWLMNALPKLWSFLCKYILNLMDFIISSTMRLWPIKIFKRKKKKQTLELKSKHKHSSSFFLGSALFGVLMYWGAPATAAKVHNFCFPKVISGSSGPKQQLPSSTDLKGFKIRPFSNPPYLKTTLLKSD